MTHMADLPVQSLLAPNEYTCACGHVHRAQLAYLQIRAGAISSFPEALAVCNAQRPFFICDSNTKAAAWPLLSPVLEAAAIPYALHMLEGGHIEPDEHAVGSIAMAFDPTCDVIVAIGSGVLNDCAKVLAHATGRPSMVIATAPSMDGYASNSSSMVVGGVKSTLYNQCPVAIIADTDILMRAPDEMLQAGFGDMIAKYVALCEWRISNLVTGEAYCEDVAAMMRRSVAKIVQNAGQLMSRSPQAIEAVTEGLVLSGLAMAFANNSRPASGLEHYFSHLWEMMALERHTPYALHGIQVGVGTRLALRVLEQVKQIARPSREVAEAAMQTFDPAKWEANVRRVFGQTAQRILDIEATVKKNDPAKHAVRLDAILSQWDAILQIMQEELPELARMEAIMRELGMPVTPDDLNVGAQDVYNAYICSRDIRDKYLTSSLLWDLGLLETILP